MRKIFARKILRLHAAKIGAGNVIKKRFMTFPIRGKRVYECINKKNRNRNHVFRKAAESPDFSADH